jgi:hypothetical protein
VIEEPLTLSDDQLDRLAELVALKVAAMGARTPQMLTVEDVAKRYRVSRDWVYDNAARLGAIKLGPTARARLRFDPERIDAAMQHLDQALPAPAKAAKSKPAKRSRRLHPVYDG